MTTPSEDLQKQNAIAYNKPLREQLQIVDEMLGVEVTDIANDAIQYSIKFQINAEKVLKTMSKLAADLSILLIKAKESKKALNKDEVEDFEAIKSLTGTLGNLQFKLSRLINKTKASNEINTGISQDGLAFAESIMEAQQQFRKVRASINAFGFMSQDPDVAHLFDAQDDEL